MYFSVRNDSELVIKAKRKRVARDDWEIIILIPHNVLEGDLPAPLIEGHVHWLSFSTSVLEICPLNSIWETSPKNWKIDCIPGQYRVHRGHELLVDIRSPSWAMVSELLKPLEPPSNLLISASPIDSGRPSSSWQLSVVLPRYGLSFYIDKDGDLQSRDIRGMVYDENQCVGTLFGLINRLVLRPKVKDVDVVYLIPRCVLIPEGEISFRKLGHHVCVNINTPRSAASRVTYQTYQIDTDLGCLEAVGLTNKLYCAYLHALTSGCGTDPLSGRSGTEEALSLLWSASCWSIMKFSPRDAELLSLIASLYPLHIRHLDCMQQVEWLDLPANSQHHELYIVAKAIKRHYERLRSFHQNQSNKLFEKFPFREDHLLDRSARRALYLFPSDSSWQPSGETRSDVQYTGRDLVQNGPSEHRAYTAATIVYHRTAQARITEDIVGMIESWTTLSKDAPLSLQYNRSWLNLDLPSMWLGAYNLLRGNDRENWFQLLFTLPAMAYASPTISHLVPVLVALASHPPSSFEGSPSYTAYTPPGKRVLSRAILRGYVSDTSERSVESSESARCNEAPDDTKQGQLKMYDARPDSDTDATVDKLQLARRCVTPPRCSVDSELGDMDCFTSNAESQVSSYRSIDLKEHLTRVQEVLRNAHVSPTPFQNFYFAPSKTIPSYTPWTFTVKQLFSRSGLWLPEHDTLPYDAAEVENTSFSGAVPLQRLITTSAASAMNPFQHRYTSALRASAESFESEMSLVSHGATELPDAEILMTHYARCRTAYAESVYHLEWYLGPRSRSERALQQSGQWPRMTPRVVLRLLASNSPVKLSNDWKECLTRLALLLLQVQRARRLLRLYLDNHHEELRRELQNGGCDGWKPEMRPDWLLIQVRSSCGRYVYLLTKRTSPAKSAAR